MKILLHSMASIQPPLLEYTKQILSETGHKLVSSEWEAKVYLGSTGQGFSQATIQQLEEQIVERFLGAELFLQARAFPFARIRCGLNDNDQLLIAMPTDEGLIHRLAKLLQQYQQITPTSYEEKMEFDTPKMDRQTLIIEEIAAEKNSSSQQDSFQSWLEKHELVKTTKRPNLDEFDISATMKHLFRSTTAQRIYQHSSGAVVAVFAFPNLLQPNAKILVVTKDGGILAFHRKNRTLIYSKALSSLLNISPAEKRQGLNIPMPDISLIGEAGSLVYFIKTDTKNNKNTVVYSWNGSRVATVGPKSSLLNTLSLQWSRR